MTMFMDPIRNIIGLFIDDAFLAIAVLVVIAATAFLVLGLEVHPLIGGGVLLAGSVAVLIRGTVRTARRQERSC